MSFFASHLDFSSFWLWILALTRITGILVALPGIGTDQTPQVFRFFIAMLIGVAVAATGEASSPPPTVILGMFAIFSEFTLGFLLGFIPSFIIAALAVSGQVVAGAIGLGQANMIDPSLGGTFSVIARVQSMLATIIFLLIDGHHIILRAGLGVASDIGKNMFMPDMAIASLLLLRFKETFDLALIVSAPILVTILITQFVLGLLTKFVPQMNIFIISLPLTIGLGLYIIAFTFPGMTQHVLVEFAELSDIATYVATY